MSRLALALAVLVAATSGFAADRPNVLFLMSDDLRPELGCYGVEGIDTPNIDALAEAGVKFERAYVQYPLCNPSRTSLLTGRYPTTTGVLDNSTWFGSTHPEIVSLPRLFKDNGYASLRAGKIFHGGIDDAEAWTEGGEPRNFQGGRSNRKPPTNRAQQSDRSVVLDGDGESHGDYKAADRAIAYLREYKDKPFFLACGFTKPHSPPTAPKKLFDLYNTADIPLPSDFAARPAAPDGFPPASITKNGDLFIGRDATEDEAREMKRAYWASATFTDRNVGRVLEELDRLGLRENTVVLFWGDHGYHLGEKGKWSKHGSLYEIGTRVPLIIQAPGAKGNGQASSRVVESIDIYPTLVELCNLPTPDGIEGDSLVALLDDPGAAWDRPAFTVTGSNESVAGVAVRTEQYRFAEYPGDRGGTMLFDAANDPHELKNLASEPAYAETVAHLRKQVTPFLMKTKDRR